MRRHMQESPTDPPKTPADDELLLTKLYFPPARPDLVPRPRLVAALAAGMAGALTLIAAPAGYGKTTLLGAWQASPEGGGRPVGWLSLDGDDDDPIRFLRYVVAALDMAAPGIGAEAARMLRAPQPPPVRSVIAVLLNRLAGLQDDLVLVIDDYQVLENPAVHEAVAYLLEHRPPRLHLVILSRADPPLPLARLRGRGQVTEIREADLRFTSQEAAQFLNEVMHLNLSDQDLAVVEARTEGWVAGLQLAALSMHGRSDRSGFLEAFAGNSRYIVGYLVEEVVARQSADVQDFLLRTSALDRLCAPLCAALLDGRLRSGTDGGQGADLSSATGILEYLERANLFVVPLDDAGFWYRYHHLFRDFLCARLQKLQPGDVPALHRRASEWYQAQGLVSEAVKHAFLSKDPAYAADVVERHGMWMLMHSDIHTVHEWCTTFPEEVMLAHPVLCLYHAGTLVLAYRGDYWDKVKERLQQAERAAAALEDAEQARSLACQAAVTRTFLRMAPNPAADPYEQLAVSQRALDLLRPGDSLRASTTLSIGYAHMALQDPQAALDTLEEVERQASLGQDHYAAVDAVFHRARLAHSQGQLGRAMQICEQGQERVRALLARPEQELPAVGCLDIARGCVLLEQNLLGEAEAALLHSLDVIGWSTNPYYRMIGCAALFRLSEIQGRHAEASEFAERLAAGWPDVEFCVRALHVLHGLRTEPEHPRTLAAAAAWCESFRFPADEHLPLPGIGPFGGGEAYYLAYLAWARAQIATGRPQAVFSYLERQIGLAEDRGLDHRLIELSIVMALALHGLGENKRACEALGRALAIAEPEGYVRTFDEGPALTRLLVETAARGISRPYVNRLLAVLGGTASEPPVSASGAARPPETADAAGRLPTSPLVEPLTDRECEVLGLLAEGLSNVDIAQKLYIEVGTVKQHVNHVMGKLEATSRTQAVARARALRLLA